MYSLRKENIEALNGVLRFLSGLFQVAILNQRRPPTRVSDIGARHRDRPKARPTDVAGGGGGQEVGNGMLGNPCSLSPCPGSFPLTSYIRDSADCSQPHVTAGTGGPGPSAPGDRKHVRCCVCSQEQTGCAACRRGIQSVSGGIVMTSLRGRPRCLASPRSDVLRGDLTTPSRPGRHVAGYPRAPSTHIPSTSNCKYLLGQNL